MKKVAVVAILTEPTPKGVPKIKIVPVIDEDPLPPVEQFKNGNPAALAALLRADEPITTEVRQFLADFVDGTFKRPRGGKRKQGLTEGDISLIRNVADALKEKGVTQVDIYQAIQGWRRGLSVGTIRNILEGRKRFAKK